jgi:hypothetical protein
MRYQFPALSVTAPLPTRRRETAKGPIGGPPTSNQPIEPTGGAAQEVLGTKV